MLHLHLWQLQSYHWADLYLAILTATIKNNKMPDIVEYHDNGTIASEAFYNNEQLLEYREYSNDGKLIKYYNSGHFTKTV